MSEYRPEAWERLARLLKSRRVHISTAYRNRTTFCQETGLNYKLVSDIENAPDTRTNFGDESFALLEGAYQLAEGSIRRTLEGGSLRGRPQSTATAPEGRDERAPDALDLSTLDEEAGDGIQDFLKGLVDTVNERLTEQSQQLAEQSRLLAKQSQQLAEQNRRIEELQRGQRDDEQAESA